MGKNCEWCIHRKRMWFCSQVHCQGWLHSFGQSISLLEKEDFLFLMEFSPPGFWPDEFPAAGASLAFLWMLTVSYLFHMLLVRLLRQGCTCIMEEHPGIWHVRFAPWTFCGHSFWPDCWPQGTNFVFLSDQDQRQPSSPSLSLWAPLSPAWCWDFSLLCCTIPLSVAKPLLCPWDFPFYLLSLLTLGSVSQLSFSINIEIMCWSIMLEERGGWAGERHQRAVFKIPILTVSTRAQKERETVLI